MLASRQFKMPAAVGRSDDVISINGWSCINFPVQKHFTIPVAELNGNSVIMSLVLTVPVGLA